MRLRSLAAVAAVPLVHSLTLPLPLAAQQPVRVLRHSPADTARPGDVITISFDRPVVGSLDRTLDPNSIVRIEPAIEMQVHWRDPATLRIIPRSSLVPGRQYRISVSSEFAAIDGGRLEAPYEFAIRTAGPRLLASIPPLYPTYPAGLEPNGRLRLVYSAPIDTASLVKSTRLELTGEADCGHRVVQYTIRSQREITESDDWSLRAAGGWDRDSAEQAFRRVVELRPVSPLPEECGGAIVLPSLDPSDRVEIRYPVSTIKRFAIERLTCAVQDCAAAKNLVLWLTAEVYRDSLLPRIHLEPAVPFTLQASDGPTRKWSLRLDVLPRTTYRLRVDSSLTDIYDRRITGRLDASLTTGDRHTALGHQLGFFTVPRSRPVLRLTHVNVDSVQLAIIPIPDSIRVTVLGLSNDPDSAARMIARLRDTSFHRVAVPARFNTERTTEIPIPPRVLTNARGTLFAIRASRIERQTVRQSGVTIRQSNVSIRRDERPPIEIVAETWDAYGPSRRTAIVQLTDLMAYAKVSDDGGAVLVADGTSGRPVSGARVTTRDARDRIIASGETDATGVATLVPATPRDTVPRITPVSMTRGSPRAAPFDGDTRLIEVTHGADRSLTPIGVAPYYARTDAVDRLGGAVYRPMPVHASVFTDRPIYRPTEIVYVTAIVRRGMLAGLRTPERGDSVRLRVLRTPPGESAPRVFRDTVLRLNEFGTAADSFSLSRRLALGSYEVQVDAFERGWQTAGRTHVELAEYRAPEFEASLAIDSAVRFVGDSITARANARYYFGAPMGGRVLRWSAETSETGRDIPIPGLPTGFIIGETHTDGPPQPDRTRYVDGVDTLDASGNVRFRIPTTVGATTTPARVSVDVVIQDLNRQGVSAQQEVVMHASSFYVAVRDSNTGGWGWRENAARRFHVIAVRPDGRQLSGVRVNVAAVRHRMSFTPQGDGSLPSVKWTTDTTHRDSVVTRDGIVRYTFTPRGGGWHTLVFSATDERGRPVRTTTTGFVVGPEWAPWTDNPLRAAMQIVRSRLAPGDTLLVRFVSPFPRAEAWVTVEREAVLAQRRLTVSAGESTVRIPVTDAFFPGAQVSLVLIDSGATWTTDSTHQRFRASYDDIRVSGAAKQLAVEVKPAKSHYMPGDSARITVAVRDHRSMPVAGQVTLWAVDEGILALTGYERPDPLSTIYSAFGTALQFGTTSSSIASRGRLLTPPGWMSFRGAAMLSMSANAYGSSAGNGVIMINTGSVLRSDFRSTAFYLASLVTDLTGNATTTVKLPDNLTRYRVIAVAATAGNQFGSGDSTITLSKPLLARPSLPRFLRTGDTILAGAVINNNSRDSLTAGMSATGARVVALAETTATRALAAGAGTEVRFRWRTDASPGDTAVFRFGVTGGEHSDAVETKLPVQPPYAPRYHAAAGVVRGTSAIRLLLPSDIDPRRSRLTLRVGTSPAPIVRAAYERVAVYPYYCSEQLTSTGQVILAMLRLQRVGLLDSTVAPDAQTLRGRLQFVVDEIARRQNSFGGILYWPSGHWTDRWISAYAGTLLVDAKNAGVRVDSAVIARIGKFVQFEPDTASVIPGVEYGTRAERERIVAWGLAEDLAALHFLRRAGTPDTDRENAMIGVADRMVWEDRVWLAELLAGRADRSAARAQLARVWRDVETVGVRVDIPDSLSQTLGFRSHVRPVARLLRATLAIEPDHPRMGALIERVVQQGRAERDWLWNTQDYAVASSALADVATVEQRSSSSRVIVRAAQGHMKDRPLVMGARGAQSDSTITLDGLLERDGEWQALPLRLESTEGPTFYVLTVDEVPLQPPTTPDAKGMIVERWYERFDDGRPVTEVVEGDLVRGQLRITVPSDREFVAVEDLIPAGLEVVDLALRTTSLGPFESEASREAERAGNRGNRPASGMPWLYGSWVGGWWSPWEHEEKRDDRVVYFARMLWKGTYTATYVARATTAGTFVRPPAHAEEMYNASVSGRSDGGTFRVLPRK